MLKIPPFKRGERVKLISQGRTYSEHADYVGLNGLKINEIYTITEVDELKSGIYWVRVAESSSNLDLWMDASHFKKIMIIPIETVFRNRFLQLE